MNGILLFADGPWGTAVLRRLQSDGHGVVGLVIRKRPSDPGLQLAGQSFGIPILQPENVNAESFLDQVQHLAPRLQLSMSFDQKIHRELLDMAPLGFINFHAGKLPYYRGRSVINWAILNGETEIGLTAHYMDEGLDTGDIILQRSLPVGWTDNFGDVLSRAVESFPELVSETLSLLDQGKVTRRSQVGLVGTYFPRREEGDEWLDWSDTARHLHNKIRALTVPGPGALTCQESSFVRIWHAYYDPAWPLYQATPGQVVQRRADGVLIKVGDSTLRLLKVQVEGGDIQTPSWPVGTRLGLDFSRMAFRRAQQEKLTGHV